ncbi:helicase [Microbispora bryophytorum]|uniref:DNA helicase n=2 Tax=Microbispora bryophytorum TaxID=1460882 RepID=A0A8H9GTT9_9ACTN|nr:helicase [Microbispora bryophytorum]TQS09853.1 helicase [Microbispora bryophytorum]GGN98905.1 DNA helicase [Microbispora bryophytorum]
MSPREKLLGYLRQQLIGPVGELTELIEEPPNRRYLMGTLYPQDTDRQQSLTKGAEDTEPGAAPEDPSEETRFADDTVPDANAWLPSSMGISFYTDAEELTLICRGARYETRRGKVRNWQRIPLEDFEETFKAGEVERDIWDSRAQIRLRWRSFAGNRLVTVALVNTKKAMGDHGSQWDDMLFQVSLEVRPVDGELLRYPSIRLTSRDLEEQELRLQYRHVVTHAVGHSCAVDEIAEDGRVVGLRTQMMPEAEVPAIRPAGPSGLPVLKLAYLSDPDVADSRLHREIMDFIRGYRNWCQGQRTADLPPGAHEAAERILDRLDTAVRRMELGADALFADSSGHALRAFRLANRAMALQMRHSGRDLGGRRRKRSEAVTLDPDPSPDAAWHPFQLGFFLLSVCGLIDESHPDREVVDLLWFPTGGGKTEAYLFLAAFEMILRRLRHGDDGGGTAVLSRYTLSLLTTQQFQRAATTVCALEYLRLKEDPVIPGGPFSIGLWVGGGTTPNKYAEAHEMFRQQREAARPKDVFILDRCPWCGTQIMPTAKSPDIGDYGVRTTETSFQFLCPREECHFHERLPVAVVDEHLYADPPTFVLGTVDKFARLAWEPDAGRLFGGEYLPPSLVIQDELHLLTGPLGTTVGLYEAAVLELCSWSGAHGPKVVASTATIRRASEQIRALYGRDVQLFPSAGLDARYSYFAEPDDTVPGRKYVGVMAQGHTAGRATAVTAAAMLHAPMELPEERRDDYWTLVAYHHSMRELGRTRTAAGDEIPAHLRGLGSPGRRRVLTERQVEELSSNLDRSEQPKLLDRLELSYEDLDSVSMVVCTNMLSVGVDVKRLALMLMLGQPKATAEYIQASSRVGRHGVPGLVVTFLNATRSRDRSHYETFGIFHKALYQHVEPTSVTPWSIPSRRRALHAALVILVRHGLGLSADDQAGDVLHHAGELAEATSRLVRWVAKADPSAVNEVRADLDGLRRAWLDAAEHARQAGKRLYYKPAGKAQASLLKNFDRPGGMWETQHSMRSVDRECQVVVKGAGE